MGNSMPLRFLKIIDYAIINITLIYNKPDAKAYSGVFGRNHNKDTMATQTATTQKVEFKNFFWLNIINPTEKKQQSDPAKQQL